MTLRIVFEELRCAHCREPLPDSIRPNSGLCRCPTCRRLLLVKDRLLGIPLAKGNVASVTKLVMLLCPITCLVAAPLLFYADDASLALICLCLCMAVMGAALGYDGWLSLATGRDTDPMGCRADGFDAIVLGAAKLFVGLAFVCGGLYMLVRDIAW